MVRYLTYTVFTFLFLFNIVAAQSGSNIKQKNSELAKIQSDIKKLETDLSKEKENEKQSGKLLDNINHQLLLLNKIIQKYRKEERQLNKKINVLTAEINSLKSEIKKLQDDYAHYVRWLYMNAHDSKLSFLINSDSFNQAIVRYKYLNYITDKNEERLVELVANKKVLEEKTEALKKENNKKHKLLVDKRKEKNRLVKREKEKEKLIAQLERLSFY
ncbi:MAG: hypothetical protein GXO85_14005, partial [Chlorobi bacterium]|nr:hypothetical protein [Chlorobiota bacterium]